MIVWGNYDEYLLRKNLNMYKYKKGEICKYAFGNRVKNIQSKFEEIMYLPNSTCSLSKALSIIGEPFLGVKHSGINDVKNMLKVFAFINRIDKSKYIEKNKMFVDYINEIRERNKKEIEKRELQKLKRKEEKEMI
jgi:inhibitor of KinA sporulation pathway (predicted exonuclease)